jgi:hypothetical protein
MARTKMIALAGLSIPVHKGKVSLSIVTALFELFVESVELFL